MQNNSSTAICG